MTRSWLPLQDRLLCTRILTSIGPTAICTTTLCFLTGFTLSIEKKSRILLLRHSKNIKPKAFASQFLAKIILPYIKGPFLVLNTKNYLKAVKSHICPPIISTQYLDFHIENCLLVHNTSLCTQPKRPNNDQVEVKSINN